MPERDVLSIKEAARYLRVRASRVQALLTANELLGKNLGTHDRPAWRIHRTELLWFLTDFSKGPTPAEPTPRQTRRLPKLNSPAFL